MQCGWSAHRVLATAAAAVAEVAVAPHHRLFSPQDQIVSDKRTTAGQNTCFSDVSICIEYFDSRSHFITFFCTL